MDFVVTEHDHLERDDNDQQQEHQGVGEALAEIKMAWTFPELEFVRRPSQDGRDWHDQRNDPRQGEAERGHSDCEDSRVRRMVHDPDIAVQTYRAQCPHWRGRKEDRQHAVELAELSAENPFSSTADRHEHEEQVGSASNVRDGKIGEERPSAYAVSAVRSQH